MNIIDLKKSIYIIGEKLVQCNNNCEGASHDLTKGIMPRGLMIEERTGTNGCVVVGINPANPTKTDDLERCSYIKDPSYSQQLEVFNQVKDYKYHTQIKRFLSDIGFDGNILWTELVKCENQRIPIDMYISGQA